MKPSRYGDQLDEQIKPHLLRLIAKHTPFPLPDIEAAHSRLGSYDVTITATIIACEQNVTLADAVDMIQLRIAAEK